MNQAPRDLRPPEDAVRISARQVFRQGYEVFRDESTPDDLTGYVFSATLCSQSGQTLLTLSEGSSILRPDQRTILITVTADQLTQLRPGQFRLYLYGTRLDERELFVIINLTVEP